MATNGNNAPDVCVRSLYDTFELETDTIDDTETSRISVRLKILFPAEPGTLTATVHDGRSPYPIVIFFSGKQVESSRYQWLGEQLVKTSNVIYITTEVVTEQFGATVMLPFVGGIEQPIGRSPDLVGLFNKLKNLNEMSILAGHMKLDRIVVGGHSFGGRIALVEAANRGCFPDVVGGFAYGAHTLLPPGPEIERGTVMPLEGSVPLLWLAGSADEICSNHQRFGLNDRPPTEFFKFVFDKAIAPGRKCYCVVLDGFNHMCMVHPEDNTQPFVSIDGHASHNKTTMQNELFHIISLFVGEHAWKDEEAAKELKRYLFGGESPFVKIAMHQG